MTTEEIRGRRITAAIAAWSLVPALIVVGASVSGQPVAAGAWVMNVGLQILFAWLLYQGYRWVRILTVVGCALAVLMSGVRLVAGDASFGTRLVILLAGGMQGLIGFVLWRSPAVRAYFMRQDSPSSLNLSGA
jgi:hypothetical protein